MSNKNESIAQGTDDEHFEQVVISPAIKDAFRSLRDQKVAMRSTAATRAMAAFNTIRLPYPRQLEAMLTFQEAQDLGRSMKGGRQTVVCVFDPPHTGKTTAAENFTDVANEGAEQGKCPVALISLGSGGGPLYMYRAVLKVLGEGFPATKDLEIMRDRACEAMRHAGTELVIIDEAHEAGKGSAFGPSLTAELKTLLNGGHVGIILLGTEKANEMVSRDQEFLMRTMAPCRLGALDWAEDEDRDLWIGFLSKLDEEMVRIGIVAEPAGLAEDDLALALWQACDGVIGQLMSVVRQALRISIHDDRECICVDDLVVAIDDWSIALGLCNTNPLERLLLEAA
ncbi:ATP-binding protein [Erythrobacter sp. QSSC1-22B]|uniref:ATP-binding protein n=1 Tax=Erythrobacter sp. QSSC1-22B TaxID=1860125 RepID=UPI000A658FA8|nr:ATP-binding protein [Erythrobacter sp. QSSC1-22B]